MAGVVILFRRTFIAAARPAGAAALGSHQRKDGRLELVVLPLVARHRNKAAVRIFLAQHLAHIVDAVLLDNHDVLAVALQAVMIEIAFDGAVQAGRERAQMVIAE